MKALVVIALAACGGTAPKSWTVPAGWKSETIPFPLDFAKTLPHRGVEELRFAPGMFDPAAPGYWSYTFVWRTEDVAALGAADLDRELTAYFRGLIGEVDPKIADLTPISIHASAEGEARFSLTGSVIDAFKTKQQVALTGWAERRACGAGAVWVFVLSPPASGVRKDLDALAATAQCGQPALRNKQ